ncbi:hypothetical protein ACHHYP_06644 [Achlya hypogyna]|uniref:Transmembrane protein n=1 Tax=Achlya hypogyna TaxID=1202772 RepID=A0A1V9YSG1_ACHHY|nr:hypothetical protein ACHHYP_06644 [Achlya hypogyna]
MQQRRPPAVKQSSSGGSMWDKEASDFWKDMKVDDNRKKLPSASSRLLSAVAVSALVLLGSLYVYSTRSISVDLSEELRESIVRANCTKLAVQSRWHADMCQRICPDNEFNEPCTNGCLYGTMTVTKEVCIDRPLNATESAMCPYRVDCAGACVEYANVRPIPAKRNACEGGCSSVVPSSCKRAMDLLDELAKMDA